MYLTQGRNLGGAGAIANPWFFQKHVYHWNWGILHRHVFEIFFFESYKVLPPCPTPCPPEKLWKNSDLPLSQGGQGGHLARASALRGLKGPPNASRFVKGPQNASKEVSKASKFDENFVYGPGLLWPLKGPVSTIFNDYHLWILK